MLFETYFIKEKVISMVKTYAPVTNPEELTAALARSPHPCGTGEVLYLHPGAGRRYLSGGCHRRQQGPY